jgi:hypothetical protein
MTACQPPCPSQSDRLASQVRVVSINIAPQDPLSVHFERCRHFPLRLTQNAPISYHESVREQRGKTKSRKRSPLPRPRPLSGRKRGPTRGRGVRGDRVGLRNCRQLYNENCWYKMALGLLTEKGMNIRCGFSEARVFRQSSLLGSTQALSRTAQLIKTNLVPANQWEATRHHPSAQ